MQSGETQMPDPWHEWQQWGIIGLIFLAIVAVFCYLASMGKPLW